MPKAARRLTLAVPDRRSGLVSGGERNTRRLACEPSGVLTTVLSLREARRVGERQRVGRAAADAAERARGGRPSCRAGTRRCSACPGSASSLYCFQSSAASSIVTIGSASMPLLMPCSCWSNQRCSVLTHSARRCSNGSVWPARSSHSLRLTLLAPSASHHRRGVVHADVVVLEAVDDEDRRLDLAGVLVVVAVAPELVDVAVLVTVLLVLQRPRGRAQGLAGDHLAGRVGRARRLHADVALDAGDRAREPARVVGVVADAAGARVVVPSGNGADRDDRGQALDARRGGAVGERAVVGLADHARLAVVPVGGHVRAAGLRR